MKLSYPMVFLLGFTLAWCLLTKTNEAAGYRSRTTKALAEIEASHEETVRAYYRTGVWHCGLILIRDFGMDPDRVPAADLLLKRCLQHALETDTSGNLQTPVE